MKKLMHAFINHANTLEHTAIFARVSEKLREKLAISFLYAIIS